MKLINTLVPSGASHFSLGFSNWVNGDGVEPPLLKHFTEQATGGRTTQPEPEGAGADIWIVLISLAVVLLKWKWC